jgi:hypothetical protein
MLLALILCPAEVINNGYLSVAGFSSGATFSFGNSAQGFSVSNVGSSGVDGSLNRCSPCAAGQLTSISANFSGEGGLNRGAAMVGGINYAQVYYTGVVSLTAAPIVIPSDTSPFVTINVPFTLNGFINGYETSARLSPPIFSMMLEGQGIATLVLSSYFTQSHGWLYDFHSITYNFSPTTPTPEPATLLLFGTGLAAAAARYRRRFKGQTKQ